ncbi:MAG: 2-oxoacid:acceptor oxidoreductase family protein [Gammaproteobacteria bacterium]|nr:2-oxoacid:acceptor oxidoreductase family protein [Gammaproteobacteria bacterium]
MIELRIHGRGGQGNVVAAYLMAAAAIKEQRYGQAFPAFGAERRGAPVQAFVRIADVPIRRRSQVAEPDFLIVQDQALLHVPGVLVGLRRGGGILVNSIDSSEHLSEQTGHPTIAFNATALAQRHLGRPVPNTALLAAFLSLSEVLPIGALAGALSDRFKGKVLEKNLSLIEDAAQQVPGGIWKTMRRAPEVANG